MSKKILLIFLALIILYSLFFFFRLTEIGPEYDELAFINAAFGCPNPSMFLHLFYSFGNSCLPVMIMPYLGAIHAYLLRFAFNFFESNLLTLRATNYFLMIISFLLISFGLSKILKWKTTLLIIFLLMFDPQLLLASRYEKTIIVPFLLRSLFIFLLFYTPPFLKYFKPFLLGLLIGLSVFAKLDVLFVLGSITTGIIITAYLYKDRLNKVIHSFNLSIQSLLTFVLGIFVGVTPLFLYLQKSWREILETNKVLSSAPDLLPKKIFYILTQFSSTQLIEAIFRIKSSIQPSWFLSSLIFLILIFVAIKLIKKSWLLSILSISLFTFYLMVMVYRGLGAWGKMHHYILIYPIPQILLSYYFFEFKNYNFNQSVIKKLKKLFFLVFISLFAITYYNFHQLSDKTCGRQNWSCNINDVLKLVQQNSRQIVVGDWGIATQLLFLTGGQRQVNELVFKADASNTLDLAPVMEELQKNCANFVMSSPESTIFLKAREVIIPFLEKDSNYDKTIIYNRENHPYLEIYRCKDI